MSPRVALYNPREMSPEQLNGMLVGRERLLEELLLDLRQQAQGSTRQHWLLRGQRGIGKTHLSAVLYHRVRSDAELSRAYLPIWLAEAEVYGVYSPGMLLQRVARRLTEAVPGCPLAAVLRELQGPGDSQALFEELFAQLEEEARRQERILLVLMENLDALLASFAPKQQVAQTRQLRSLLLHGERFLFISTTPTKHMKALSHPREPLFGHLKERTLHPLTEEEVGLLHEKLLAARGGLKETGEEEVKLRRHIIHRLSGGLPRSVVMALEVMRDRAGVPALVEDLRTLLDSQTGYFEARLKSFNDRPRECAIVTTLALCELGSLTLKEIADRSHLPLRSLSTLVNRLEEEGHVEKSLGGGGKGTRYELSEGMFRLWYQYRMGRPMLRPLVEMLAWLYRADELQDTAHQLHASLLAGTVLRQSTELALHHVQEAIRMASSEEVRQGRQDMELEEALRLFEAGQVREGSARLERLLAALDSDQGERALEVCRRLLGACMQLEVPNEVIAEIGRLAAWRFLASKDQFVADLAAEVQGIRGIALYQTGQHEQAVSCLDDAIPRLSRMRSERLRLLAGIMRLQRARALYALGRMELAIEDLRKVAKMPTLEDGTRERIAVEGMMLLAHIYITQNDMPRALEVHQGIVKMFGEKTNHDYSFSVVLSKLLLAGFGVLQGGTSEALSFVRHVRDAHGGDVPPRQYEEYAGMQYLSWLVLALNGDAELATQEFLLLLDFIENKASLRPYFVKKIFENDQGLYKMLGGRRFHDCLLKMQTWGLKDEDRNRLHLWLLYSEASMIVQESEVDRSTKLEERVRDAVARIPPELRQDVLALLERSLEAELQKRAAASVKAVPKSGTRVEAHEEAPAARRSG